MHAKNVYVLTRIHLNQLQNLSVNKYVLCNVTFEEEDVIATSTSNRYCYNCAVKINLVSGNTRKDICNDKLVPNILKQIKKLTKYSINSDTSSLAMFLIKTIFDNANYVTKNQLGLSCVVILLASKLLKENDNSLKDSLSVSPITLGKNIYQLQKSLSSVNMSLFSQNIRGVKH